MFDLCQVSIGGTRRAPERGPAARHLADYRHGDECPRGRWCAQSRHLAPVYRAKPAFQVDQFRGTLGSVMDIGPSTGNREGAARQRTAHKDGVRYRRDRDRPAFAQNGRLERVEAPLPCRAV